MFVCNNTSSCRRIVLIIREVNWTKKLMICGDSYNIIPIEYIDDKRRKEDWLERMVQVNVMALQRSKQ